MANLLPRIPMLDDIKGMQTSQLQAFCSAWELPNNQQKVDDMRQNLTVLRLILQGDPHFVTQLEAWALFDAWDIAGDYSTSPPEHVLVTLIGYAAALALRANALGYCRNPATITAKKNPRTSFTGTGECDITVDMEANEPIVFRGTCLITVTVSSAV